MKRSDERRTSAIRIKRDRQTYPATMECAPCRWIQIARAFLLPAQSVLEAEEPPSRVLLTSLTPMHRSSLPR
jgi:hypothetical protein